MDKEQYDIMYQVERVHWWYRGMRRNTRALLRRYLPAGRLMVLDAGCGTGGTTIDLAEFGTVTGVDFSPDALAYAKTRGLKRLVRGSIERLPFPDDTFDLVTCFDVLYHRAVGDERNALAEFRRVLLPGGMVLVRDPAFDWLRGAHDIGIHTERRFTTRQLSDRMRQVGLDVVFATYGNMLLFPMALAKRAMDRFIPSPADLDVPPKPINRMFEAALSLEAPLAGRVPLPVGLSAIALGRKAGGGG
jgi:ubiquinone/menaquinone biosynthesis C-methylase UbiE